MPTYQYECSFCQHEFEALQAINDNRLKKCPKCGKSTLHRLIGSGSGIIFRGGGFYETDYKRKVPTSETQSGSKSKPAPTPSETGHGCSSNCGCGG